MKRTTLAGLAVAVLLTVLVLVGLTVFRRQVGDAWQTARDYRQMRQDISEGRRFPQALADAKARGVPTRMADLQKPLPPPERNAAPIYVRLTQMLKARPFTKSEDAAMTLHPGMTPSGPQWAQIARLLYDRADVMALVHQAAARPDCVFTRNWAKGSPAAILFPELSTVRASARLLEMESLSMAHQGRFMDAARNQALGFQVARHGASDNLLLSYLVGLAGDAITLNGMQRIMTLAGPNAGLDNTLNSLIARDWKPRSLSSALRIETGFGLGDISYLRQAGPKELDDDSSENESTQATLAAQGIDSSNWNTYLDYTGVFYLTDVTQTFSGRWAEVPATGRTRLAEPPCRVSV